MYSLCISLQVAKPPKENAKLQRKNNELATEVEQLTKQVSQLRGSKTTLSNENRDLQQTVVQVQLNALYCMCCTKCNEWMQCTIKLHYYCMFGF